MASVYNSGLTLLLTGSLDWEDDDVIAALVTSSYSFDPTHGAFSDLTNEVSDGSYSRQLLTNVAVTQDDVADESVITADPVAFGALDNVTPGGLVLFKLTGGSTSSPDAACPLIAYFSEGFGASADGLGYTVRWGGDDDATVARLRGAV